MPLASGAHIGPYEIVSTLGVGGMGEVYRARDAKLHREVAIEVLPATFASDPDRVERGGKAVIFSVGTLASPDTYEDSNIDAVIVATGERRTVLKGPRWRATAGIVVSSTRRARRLSPCHSIRIC
jgi:serine/threonine protein kinase